MKFYQKVLLSLLFAVVLEMTWFQLPVWRIRLDGDAVKDVRCTLSDMEPENWTQTPRGYVSGDEASLRLATVPTRIYRLRVFTDTEPGLTGCTLSYTDGSGEEGRLPVELKDGRGEAALNKTVDGSLRILPHASSGLLLRGAEVEINPTAFHVSVSRIAAVVLIYTCGSLLFRIQRMPDYTRYIQKKKEDA